MMWLAQTVRRVRGNYPNVVTINKAFTMDFDAIDYFDDQIKLVDNLSVRIVDAENGMLLRYWKR